MISIVRYDPAKPLPGLILIGNPEGWAVLSPRSNNTWCFVEQCGKGVIGQTLHYWAK